LNGREGHGGERPRTPWLAITSLHEVPKRTTLTLEDDVAEKVRRVALTTGKSIETVVNEALRAGLSRRPERIRFRVRPHDLGLQPELDLEDVGRLLDHIEGPNHR
jgi:hypothetical protein